MSPPDFIVADPKSAPEPPWEDDAGDSGNTQESPPLPNPERELPFLERELPLSPPLSPIPPAVRALEEGGSAGEERAAQGPDYTERVMTLLGMGHRLFVPRLLAVRDS